MNLLFVVSRVRDWPFRIDGVTTVSARSYLTDPAHGDRSKNEENSEENSEETRVFNLCSTCSYQSPGYYVSMLAEARGHQPLPDVRALEDLQSDSLMQCLADKLAPLLQDTLDTVMPQPAPDLFAFDLLFGRADDARLDVLAEQLFNLLRAPLARMEFERRSGRWHLRTVHPLPLTRLEPERLQRAGKSVV